MNISVDSSSTATPRRSIIGLAVAAALLGASAQSMAATNVHGVVAGTYFTSPVISDSPAHASPSSTVPSVYAGAKVCFDLNNNGQCDANEPSTTSKGDGSFVLSSATPANVVAEISTSATNNGNAVSLPLVLRTAA